MKEQYNTAYSSDSFANGTLQFETDVGVLCPFAFREPLV
jgi:hypothetical protein